MASYEGSDNLFMRPGAEPDSHTQQLHGSYTSGSGVKLNKTCQACRKRKIKCDIKPGDLSCTRCRKKGYDCIFNAPATRKARQTNASRIRELERRFRELQGEVVTRPPGSDSQVTASASHDETASPADAFSPNHSSPHSGPLMPSEDPFDNGQLTEELFETLYSTFANDVSPVYPWVQVPLGLSWRAVRDTRPALFRGIVTAGAMCSGLEPALARNIFKSSEEYIVRRVILDGEKSLDLLQGLLAVAKWTRPPKKFQNFKHSHYASIAGTIMQDLALGNENCYRIPAFGPGSDFSQITPQQMELCRTFSACYFLTSSLSFAFRRQPQLRWGKWVENCVAILRLSPRAADEQVSHWLRLQGMAEQAFAAIGIGDQREQPFTNFPDQKILYILKMYIQKVFEWREGVPEELLTAPMKVHYHSVVTSLYEPWLYNYHSIGDFRPPYAIRAHPIPSKNPDQPPSVDLAKAHAECLLHASEVIKIFVDAPIKVLRALPSASYTRLSYSFVVLIKLFVSSRVPGSPESMFHQGIAHHRELFPRIIASLDAAVEGQPQRYLTVATFSSAMKKLSHWCEVHLESDPMYDDDEGGEDQEYIEPMKNLAVEDDELDPSDRTASQSQSPRDFTAKRPGLPMSLDSQSGAEGSGTSPDGSRPSLDAQSMGGMASVGLHPYQPQQPHLQQQQQQPPPQMTYADPMGDIGLAQNIAWPGLENNLENNDAWLMLAADGSNAAMGDGFLAPNPGMMDFYTAMDGNAFQQQKPF